MDNLGLRGKPDRDRINIHEPWEVQHWCSALNCTAAQLRQAVGAVGPMVKDVRRYLGR